MSAARKRFRERKVVQWGLAYVAGAWLVLQIVDVFSQNLGWPGWVFRVTAAVLAVGLLGALVLAWYHGKQGRQRVSGAEVLMLAGILVLAGVAVALVWRDEAPPHSNAASARAEPSAAPARSAADAAFTVAALPLKNLSGDPGAEPFVRGIHVDLITQLSVLGGLKVISQTSVERYRESDRSLPQIADELGASWILEGDVQQVSDRVRVNARLLDARADVHVWAESYDRRLTVENIFQIQADLARKIAAALNAELSAEEKGRLGRAPTDNLEAYNLYVLGRHLADRRTAENLTKALDYFQQAIGVDPSYARAHVGIADAYIALGTWGFLPAGEAFPAAGEAARQALSLDDSLGEAWASLGFILYWYEWDWEAAEAAFQRAVALSPSYSTAHHWYSLLLAALRRFDEAEEAIGRAVQLDPVSRIIRTIDARLRWLRGEPGLAIEGHLRALELDPGYAIGHVWLALAYESQGTLEDARRHFRRAVELDSEAPVPMAGLAHLHAITGEEDLALELLEGLRQSGNGQSPVPYWSAVVYADLGQMDQAFDELERAFRVRDGWLTELGVSPLLDHLRADPRFEALLQRMNLAANSSG